MSESEDENVLQQTEQRTVSRKTENFTMVPCNLQNFKFEGNLSENWKHWYQKFEIYLLASNLNSENDARKVALLLHNLGDKCIDIFNSFNLSSEDAKKYDVVEMRLELLKYGDMNVFEVDWDKGSLPPYTQATANTRLVGLEIAFFINHLKDKYGLDPADIHLIGHSLGAHTAGYAGQNIVGLGRITGLDPAGPYFQGMPSNVRLDPSDASYVEVIHTDGSTLGYGMSDPCGHVDFYPNNGRDQPGCDVSQTLTPLALIRENTEEAARVAVACNHNRAIRLFIESINGECPYIGHPCATYQSFLKGECFSSRGVGAAVMGLKSLKGNGLPGSKYFFMTSDKAPYCRYHYRVTLGFAKPSKAEQTIEGQIKITLHGEKTARECDLTPSRPQKFVHGTLHKFLNTDTVDTGPVHKADVRWRRNSNVLSPTSLFNCALSCNDHLYVRNVTVDVTSSTLARGDDLSKSLYPMGVEYGDISSSGAVTFVDQCTL